MRQKLGYFLRHWRHTCRTMTIGTVSDIRPSLPPGSAVGIKMKRAGIYEELCMATRLSDMCGCFLLRGGVSWSARRRYAAEAVTLLTLAGRLSRRPVHNKLLLEYALCPVSKTMCRSTCTCGPKRSLSIIAVRVYDLDNARVRGGVWFCVKIPVSQSCVHLFTVVSKHD